jgi:glucosamine-6-phosphate deaminase
MTGHSETRAPLDLRVFDSAAALANHGADLIARIQHQCRLDKRPFVLGLAAGASPEAIYTALIKRRERGEMHFDDCVTFCLDEYYPLSPRSTRSFHRELGLLQDRLGIPEENRYFLSGDIPLVKVSDHCAEYEQEIRRAGGVDLQLLGVGRNGHIGFNEPGSMSDSRSRLVQLESTTRADALPHFGALDAVPKAALTMGIGAILEARALLLVVNGAHKREIVARFIQTEPTPDIPVTFLKCHGALHIFVDETAWPKTAAMSSPREDFG